MRLARRDDRDPIGLRDDARRRNHRIVAGFDRQAIPLEEMRCLFETAAQRALVEGLRRTAHRLAASLFLRRLSFPPFPERRMHDVDPACNLRRVYVCAAKDIDARGVMRAQRKPAADGNDPGFRIAEVRVQKPRRAASHADVRKTMRRMSVLAGRELERVRRLNGTSTLHLRLHRIGAHERR